MSYTITSAVYANEEHTSAVLMTEEAGSVAISEHDTPEAWEEMLAWGEPGAFTPPPAPSPRVLKADIWRRATDVEAEAMDAMLTAQPVRLRNIYRDAQYLDEADDLYPQLLAGLVALFGETRAAELLAPS